MNEPTLPGLEPTPPTPSPIEDACDTWLRELESQGKLDSKRRLIGEIMRTQAAVIAAGAASGKTSATTAVPNIIQCIEALDPGEAEGDIDDEFNDLVRRMKAAK